jgi:hypothetical protein
MDYSNLIMMDDYVYWTENPNEHYRVRRTFVDRGEPPGLWAVRDLISGEIWSSPAAGDICTTLQ